MKAKKALCMALCIVMLMSCVQITVFSENQASVNIMPGADYSLPDEIDGKAVSRWTPASVDTSHTGYGIYTAELEDGNIYKYRVNIGEWKTLLGDDFESYSISAEGKAKFNNREIFGGKFSKEAYSEGSFGGQLVNDNGNNVLSLGPDAASLGKIIFKPDENLKDGFKVSFRTKIKEFDAGHNTGTGSHQLLTINFNNTNGIGVRVYKNTVSTANAVSLLYVNSKAVNIPDAITGLKTDGSTAKTDWMDFDIIAQDSKHSVKVNGETLVTPIEWKGNMLTAGISDIRIAKPLTAEQGYGTVYVDNVSYSKAIYPTGNAPESLEAKVSVGSSGEVSKAFNIQMSDGSNKTFVCRASVDTSDKHSETVDGTVEGLNFTIPINVEVVDGSSIIESIDDLNKTVYAGDSFELPASVSAKMGDGTFTNVDVVWNSSASTDTPGVYTYTGYVNNYQGTVKFVLTVLRAVKDNVMIGIGDEFSLPAVYKGMAVNWNTSQTEIDTSNIGRQIFTGTMEDATTLVYTVNVAEIKGVFSDNMEIYDVGGKNPDYGDILEYGDKGGTSIGDHGKIVFENGVDGNKIAKIYEANEWGDFVMIAPEKTEKNYTIGGRFKFEDNQATGSLTRFVVYNDEIPQKEVCGIYMYINSAGVLEVGNSVNISPSAGANAEAYKTKAVQISGYGGEWVNFEIDVNEYTDTYDVIVDGAVCRKDCPLNLDGLKNAAFKSIKIKRYGTTNDISFDDIVVKEYTYVTGAMPQLLTDAVIGEADTERTQIVYIETSDGTQKPFEVKYTFDPLVVGTQTVEGTIAGFTEKIPVVIDVDARSIVSISEDSLKNSKKVYAGQSYTLPSVVSATMSQPDAAGNTIKNLNVTWDSEPDTGAAGVYKITGHIDGYDRELEFVLTVSEDLPISVENVNVTKELNEIYSLPEMLPVIMASGRTQTMPIDWKGEMAKTDTAGTFTYSGKVVLETESENVPTVTLKLTVNPSLVSGVNYNNTEHRLKIYVSDISELPKRVSCKYENGNSGFENVVWDEAALSAMQNETAITGQLQTSDLSAGFDGKVNATVYFYSLPSPSLEDGLDTAVWPGEHGQFKFPLGVSLIYEPFPTNNSKKFLCVQDPDNSANKVMKYENSPEFSNNDKMNYCALVMPKAKGGFVVAETKIKLPSKFTRVRYRLLTGKSREFCVLELYGNKQLKALGRKNVGVENAFPLDKWFTLKITANQAATSSAEQTYDIYIDGVYMCTAPWYQEPSETNGVGQGVKRIDFRNDADETFVMYLDDAKLYFLDDLMENVYTAINDIPATVTQDIILPGVIEGALITWHSSDEAVLSADGRVTRPPYNSADKKVTLTADIVKQFGCFASTSKKEHQVTVKKADATANDIVQEALNSLFIPAETHSDLQLKKSYSSASIQWSSSNEDVIDNDGGVYPVDSDTMVVLTATASYNGQSATRTFNVKVIHTDEITDIQRVRAAIKKTVLPTRVNSNVSLPTTENGVQITWISGSMSVISSNGTLTKNNRSDTAVTLKAVFSYNDVSLEKSYSLIVAAFSGGQTGGGSGGVGGKSSYVSTKPAGDVTPPVQSDRFDDLAGYEWAKDAIEELADKGIINGTGNKKYNPSKEVLREEFVAMAVRALKLKKTDNETSFNDVKETDWFGEDVNIAYGAGIISGISSTEFGAGKNITRQDMAVILYNIAKYCSVNIGDEKELIFGDKNDIAQYAVRSVDFLYQNGIIKGDNNNMYPGRPATRAETAQMLCRFLNKFADNLPKE